jgi:hypothetical protein
VFERGLSACTYDAKCVQLFESYVLMEQAHQQFKSAAKIYRRGINVAMPYSEQLWTSFSQFAALHDFDVLATEEGDAAAVPEVAPDGVEGSRKDRLMQLVENEYYVSVCEKKCAFVCNCV